MLGEGAQAWPGGLQSLSQERRQLGVVRSAQFDHLYQHNGLTFGDKGRRGECRAKTGGHDNHL
jgi:hypothetical protein